MNIINNIIEKIETDVEDTKKNSFKNHKRYRKKSLNGNNTKSIAIDDFGNPFRAFDEKDKAQIISITLPASLIEILDKKRKTIPRSRYLREMVEFCLDIEMKDKSITKS